MSINNLIIWGLCSMSILIYIFALPGFALLLLFGKKTEGLDCLAISLGLGIVLIPMASFSIAMLFGTVVMIPLVFVIATAINLAGLTAFLIRKLK